MYISKVKIQNYRNFSEFEVELKPFTLIIGENNSGKTNFLNALCLIFSQDITYFKKRTLEHDDINYVAIDEFKKIIIENKTTIDKIEFPQVRVDVIMKDFTLDQEAVVGDWFINEELSEAQLTYIYRIKGTFDKEQWITSTREKISTLCKTSDETGGEFIKRKKDNISIPLKEYEYLILGGNDNSNRVDFYFLSMLKMEYLDALRDARRELIASREHRLLFRILYGRDEKNYEQIREKLIELQNLIKKSPELKKIKDDIKNYLDKISLFKKEMDNRVEFQFTSPEYSEILKKISLIYGDNPVNVERNGLGRNNLLYISLVLSHLMDGETGNENVYYRLIGIEEPEAHLHPHLQDHLSRNIKAEVEGRKEFQIILTSHSTHIASKLDLESTVIFYKDDMNKFKNHYILKTFGTSSEDKKIVRYLKKYLDATNSAMFFAHRIILVEGISEQLLIPIFFNKYKKQKLEQIGCNVVNVCGVAFKHFLEIIKRGYFIKCVVFTDSDTGTKSENRAKELKKKYDIDTIINVQETKNSTFEKDIIENNKNNKGKNILINALIQTRQEKGSELKNTLGNADIDVENFYQLIEHYKSEFAFNLASILKENAGEFELPKFIKQGFNFLCD